MFDRIEGPLPRANRFLDELSAFGVLIGPVVGAFSLVLLCMYWRDHKKSVHT